MRSKTTCLLSLTLLAVSSTSHSIIIYDESVSGDLDPLDAIILDLSAGVNSVLGTSSFFSATGGDFDGFNLSLGAGLELLSAEYIISNTSVTANTTSLQTSHTLSDGGYFGTTLDTAVIEILGIPTQSIFGAAMPLSGVPSLSIRPEFMQTNGDGGSWDYEFRFVVASAPEPYTLALMSIGLLGIGAASIGRKCRKN